jgi:hypothetical protein
VREFKTRGSSAKIRQMVQNLTISDPWYIACTDEPAIKVIHKEKRYFTHENKEQFNLTLKEGHWENVYLSDETNTSYQSFLVNGFLVIERKFFQF